MLLPDRRAICVYYNISNVKVTCEGIIHLPTNKPRSIWDGKLDTLETAGKVSEDCQHPESTTCLALKKRDKLSDLIWSGTRVGDCSITLVLSK